MIPGMRTPASEVTKVLMRHSRSNAVKTAWPMAESRLERFSYPPVKELKLCPPYALLLRAHQNPRRLPAQGRSRVQRRIVGFPHGPEARRAPTRRMAKQA